MAVAEQTVQLRRRGHPQPSLLGIIWLVLTAGAMFALAAGKRATGRALGNRRTSPINPAFANSPSITVTRAYFGLREGLHALHETAA